MSNPNVNISNLDARYSKPTDVAAAISMQAASDAGQYAKISQSHLVAGNLWQFIGTSITNGSNAANFTYSYAPEAISMCGGLVARPDSFVAGVPGETSAGMLTRIGTLLSTNNPNAVVIETGANDAGQAVPLSTFVSNVTACIAIAKKYGPVVLLTCLPKGSGSTTAMKLAIQAQNAWIRAIVPGMGVEIADVYTALVDTTTGDMQGIYNSDDTHPTQLGHLKMAAEVAKAMKRATIRTSLPFGLVTSVTQGNGIADPLAVIGTTKPSGWFEQPGGTGTAPTYSIVSDTSGVLPAGKWAQMDFDATSAGGSRTLASPTPAVTAGDRLALCGHLQIEDVSGTWQSDVAAGTASIAYYLMNGATSIANPIQRNPGIQDPVTGFWNYGPIFALTDAAAGQTTTNIWAKLTLPTGKRVKMRIGCTGIINLTTLGAASTFAWGTATR